LTRPRKSFSAEPVRSGFELFGELVISGQDVVAVVYGEDIAKGSPVVVKLAFNPTKLANPATRPTNTGRGCAFDPTGTYLAVAHDGSPYITIYKRSGDTFTKLANPATLPTGVGYGCAFDPTGTYLAVAHSSSPRITIYNGFSRTVFKTGNSLLDIQADGVIAAGYAKENGLAGEIKEIVRIWRLEG